MPSQAPLGKGGTHKLADSSSTLVLPDDHVMLNGRRRRALRSADRNGGITKIEAVTVDRAQRADHLSEHQGRLRWRR